MRVLQDMLRKEMYRTYADLAEGLKAKCARLRIAYDSGLVSRAIERLERGGATPIVEFDQRQLRYIPVEANLPALTQVEAQALLRLIAEELPIPTNARPA